MFFKKRKVYEYIHLGMDSLVEKIFKRGLKMKKKIIYIVIVLFIFGSVGCTQNTTEIKEKDLSEYFGEYEGSFVLYDSEKKEYITYNHEKAKKQVSPCSTFKIMNSLIGLETQSVEDENTVFQWDGTRYPIESWNRNHSLETAIANSVVWYYQKLASKIGKEQMKYYLEKVDYGNKDISGGLTTFWLESSLKISPLAQVELLKKLYNEELPFQQRTISIVKNIIILAEKDGVRLSGKTGTGVVKNKSVNGWFIGYVEKGETVYYFSTNIQNENKASGPNARTITFKLLKKLDIVDMTDQ